MFNYVDSLYVSDSIPESGLPDMELFCEPLRTVELLVVSHGLVSLVSLAIFWSQDILNRFKTSSDQ